MCKGCRMGCVLQWSTTTTNEDDRRNRKRISDRWYQPLKPAALQRG